MIELAPYLFTFHIHVDQFERNTVGRANDRTRLRILFIFVFRFSAEFASTTEWKKHSLAHTHTQNHFVRFASLFRASLLAALNHIINAIVHAHGE